MNGETTLSPADLATRSLDEHAPDPASLARVFEITENLAAEAHPRIAAKLR